VKASVTALRSLVFFTVTTTEDGLPSRLPVFPLLLTPEERGVAPEPAEAEFPVDPLVDEPDELLPDDDDDEAPARMLRSAPLTDDVPPDTDERLHPHPEVAAIAPPAEADAEPPPEPPPELPPLELEPPLDELLPPLLLPLEEAVWSLLAVESPSLRLAF
jgi:hypothetical protein